MLLCQIRWWYWYQGSAGANNHFIVLMQNKFATNHTPSWWYRMMDKYLPVFLIINNTMNPKPNFQLYLQKYSPNFQGNSIMLHCWLQTLIFEPSNLPSAEAKYFKFWLISQEHLLPFFCFPFPMFSRIVEMLHLVSMSEVFLFGCNSSTKTTFDQTFPDNVGCSWVQLVLPVLNWLHFWTSFDFKRKLAFICCIKIPWLTSVQQNSRIFCKTSYKNWCWCKGKG